jgi:hypothetical protein
MHTNTDKMLRDSKGATTGQRHTDAHRTALKERDAKLDATAAARTR